MHGQTIYSADAILKGVARRSRRAAGARPAGPGGCDFTVTGTALSLTRSPIHGKSPWHGRDFERCDSEVAPRRRRGGCDSTVMGTALSLTRSPIHGKSPWHGPGPPPHWQI